MPKRSGAVLQVTVNAAIYAGEIAIIAVGLALTYSILRFANFAHIQLAVLGGYLSYALAGAGLPLPAAVVDSTESMRSWVAMFLSAGMLSSTSTGVPSASTREMRP